MNIVALDIGTYKTRALLGRYQQGQEMEIVDLQEMDSMGLRRGLIVNIEETIQVVQTILDRLVEKTQVKIEGIFVSLTNGHLESLNSKGVVAVSGNNREITEEDVDKVMQAAKAVMISMDKEILHVLPQNFTIDGVDHIRNPLGMIGVRLEAEVHIVIASSSAINNIVNAIYRAGYQTQGVILSSLAAIQVSTLKEEREMGLIFIEMGAGTTSVLVYQDDCPVRSFVLPIGGQRITSDIAQVWQISEEEAEFLKKEYGHTYTPSFEGQEKVLIRGMGTQPAKEKSRYELSQIIESRMLEIFQNIVKTLELDLNYVNIHGGVVLSGGGALLSGVLELAESVFSKPTRLGLPIKGDKMDFYYANPQYSTVLGIAYFADFEYKLHIGSFEHKGTMKVNSNQKSKSSLLRKIVGWSKEWF